MIAVGMTGQHGCNHKCAGTSSPQILQVQATNHLNTVECFSCWNEPEGVRFVFLAWLSLAWAMIRRQCILKTLTKIYTLTMYLFCFMYCMLSKKQCLRSPFKPKYLNI